MKKLFLSIYAFFLNLFASPKAKEKRVLAQGSKRLVKVLVEKETRKKEMIAWLKKATNNGYRFNTQHKVNLLIKKFGDEMSARNIAVQVKGNKIYLINARA
jgi:hypothetical protein